MLHVASRALLLMTAMAVIGIGAFFLFLRPPYLPEDLRFIGTTRELLEASAPRLADWLSLVFRVMGGFATATGLLLLGLLPSLDRMPRPVAIALAGASSVGLMTVVNFVIGSDYKWVISAIAVSWAAALILLAISMMTPLRSLS